MRINTKEKRGRQDKRAVSEVLATILIVLFVISALVIVSVVLFQFIRSKSQEITAGCVSIDIPITKAEYNQTGNITMVYVKRAGGDAEMTGMKFIFDGREKMPSSESDNTALKILETGRYIFNNITSKPRKIEVAPIVKTEAEKEMNCGIKSAITERNIVEKTIVVSESQAQQPGPGEPQPPSQPSTAGIVGYWKFDEGTGTTAIDSSGNGNIGTIYGNVETNFALASNGGIAIANSCENNDCASYIPWLNDGSYNTRWVKLPADPLPVYFGVRWNTPKIFNKIRFAGVNQGVNEQPRDYTIDISDDGLNWNIIKTITGNTELIRTDTFSPVTANYVRINAEAYSNTNSWMSIWEFEVYGTNASWATGKKGNALSFDGSDDYITIPSSNVFNFGVNPFAISIWLKGSTKIPYMNVMSYIDETARDPYYLVWFDNANGQIGISLSNNEANVIESVSNVLDGNWHNVIITRGSSNDFKIYVDGNLDNSNTFSGSIVSNTATQFRIGKQMDLYPRNFNGFIDEVAIYNRVLSSEEVSQLYQSG